MTTKKWYNTVSGLLHIFCAMDNSPVGNNDTLRFFLTVNGQEIETAHPNMNSLAIVIEGLLLRKGDSQIWFARRHTDNGFSSLVTVDPSMPIQIDIKASTRGILAVTVTAHQIYVEFDSP